MARIFKDPFVKASVPVPRIVSPYQYRRGRPLAKENLQRLTKQKIDEGLSGYVHGKTASDLEERFARALDKRDINFIFEYEVDTAFTLPHEAKLVDFVLMTPIPQPIELDSIFTHASAGKRNADRLRDIQINEILRSRGFNLIVRVTGNPIPLPTDQEIADQIVEQFI